MHRRNFIKMGSATALAISALDAFAQPQKATQAAGFRLKILATNWGFHGSADEFCGKAKAEGYDGIENWWQNDEKPRNELFEALAKHGLEIGFLCGSWESKYDPHFAQFKTMTETAAANASPKPLYLNCHSGKDFFSHEQNLSFINHTLALHKKTGVPIYHETHRSRMLFASSAGRRFMEEVPDLRLTFDVSHWCNVSESLLQDQPDTMAMAIDRADHIHARVGHSEGPQVNDPRAPEWASAVKAHFDWWDKIVERKKAKGETLTVLTEFGPPDYMPTLPYTRQPLADQWAINVHMMQVFRKRYA